MTELDQHQANDSPFVAGFMQIHTGQIYDLFSHDMLYKSNVMHCIYTGTTQ